MPKKAKKKKRVKKNSYNLKDLDKHKWKILGAIIIIAVIVIAFYPKGAPLNEYTPTEDKDEPFESDYFINEFDCTGKNTFQDDCFRKIQFYPEEEVFYVNSGEEFVMFLAIKNVESIEEIFSYSISSLNSVGLLREGCPAPSTADSFLQGNTKESLVIPSQEISVNEIIIQAPDQTLPEQGCGYIYVVDVKKGNSIYERDTVEILIN